MNYLQWNSATINITYEEGVSSPSTSTSSLYMGNSLTIYTNRRSTASTHTISYTFGKSSGVIGSNVADSVAWTPPVSLAAQIPNATNGQCLIKCDTYYGGALTGSRSVYVS